MVSNVKEKSKRGILQVIFGRTMVIIFLLLLQFLYLFGQFYIMAEFVPLYVGSEALIAFFMMLFILNTEGNPSIKLSWSILVGLMPVFGSLLYLFVRYEIGHRLNKKILRDVIKESRKYVPAQEEVLRVVQEKDEDLYCLAKYLGRYSPSSLCDDVKVKYFPLGELCFEEMLHQLENAKDFIYLEYFSIDESYMWGAICDILEKKAKEGLDVRVIYDGNCAIYSLPYTYPKELAKKGIKCHMYAPLRPMISTHYNNRDHRKILVIDGHTAFTGGINLCDEYINRKVVYGHWKDVGVMLQGKAAYNFSLMFLQLWNSIERKKNPEENTPPCFKNLCEKHKCNRLNDLIDEKGYVIPYCDNPTDDEHVGEMVYIDILSKAKKYVYIMTPYLILDNELLTAITFASKRGVDVRIILPHIPDKKYAFVLAKTHYKELLDAGVRIYEYTPGFVHAKVFLSDDLKAVVGTINLDYRSLYLNHECAVYMHGVSAIADILKDFKETMAVSMEVTKEIAQKQNLLGVMAGKLLKLVAPLM